MNEAPRKQFKAILIFLIPQVVELIAKKTQITEVQAVQAFYNSKVYSLLEQEETKVWHFSPLTLYTMYQQEKEMGYFEFPEEC
jgi:hypothetical protein